MKVLFTLLFLSSGILVANNISISNARLTGRNTANDFVLVEFNISWENSWRVNVGSSNWDAAWVFIKYRYKTQTSWQHASFHYSDGTGSGDGHTEPVNSNISSTNDSGNGNSYGVFLYSNVNRTQSTVSYSNVQLRWDYGIDGVQDYDSVEICVFAIEMVYVPQGSFYLGSGGAENLHFYQYPTSTTPYLVNSEAAINVGTTNGYLNYSTAGQGGDGNGPIPNQFPKGFDAFYCMKYEISQNEYAEFLNKLTANQAGNRYPNKNGQYRHSISGSFGSYVASSPYLACNSINYADVMAYLDWTGLRPMTELEYEKAARGTPFPVANEYAWGSTNITSTSYSLNNVGAANEGIATNYSVVAGNIQYGSTEGNINGPVRCGVFAANGGNSGRESSGGSYYGIMELSGNVDEQIITAGHSNGRVFTGIHGDGELTTSGDKNEANWPGTNSHGFGFRGGYWRYQGSLCRVSDRTNAAFKFSTRNRDKGGRGVRTAP